MLPVYIPIEGPATPNTTRVAGSLLVKNRYCTVPGCDETESAHWNLHLADAIGGRSWRRQWRRGWVTSSTGEAGS